VEEALDQGGILTKEDLARQFFPSSVSPGTLIWNITSTSEKKISYGKKSKGSGKCIVKLPFLTPEDIQNKIKLHSRKGSCQEIDKDGTDDQSFL